MKEQILDLDERSGFLSRFTRPLARKEIIELSKRRPGIYLALCLFVAALGYLFFLAIPYLLISLPFSLYTSMQSATSTEQWIYFSLEVFLFIASASTMVAVIKLKIPLPRGLELKREKFPQFDELLGELEDHYKSIFLHIDRVILSESYEIKIIKTPKYGLPVMFTNTLVIGLPVLQSMSPDYFRALLSRRIGQASLRENFLTGWLSALAPVWLQYSIAARKAGIGALPLYLFFKLYVALYRLILVGIFRADELKADLYALDLINDQDVLEVISVEMVAREFFNTKYWPNIIQIVKKGTSPEILPHANMAKVMRNGLKMEAYARSIDRLQYKSDDSITPDPHLNDRIANLGHDKPPLYPVPVTVTAADHYFGEKMDRIIDKFDKKWLALFVGKRRKSTIQ